MADKSTGTKPTDAPDVARMDDEGGAPTPAPDAATALADELGEIRKERDALQDRLLRQAAEFDNYRKRVERERKDWAQFAAVDFVQDLLPVIDDFERALQIDAPGSESYRRSAPHSIRNSTRRWPTMKRPTGATAR
jgi:molecular chaperone GrpE